MFKKVRLITIALIAITTVSFQPLRPWWGPDGHAIVANIAFQFLKPDVKKNIQSLLGDMSVDTAANWMDIMRSNSDYDFMKPWHYIDFPKGKEYQPSNEENIVNRLIIVYNELLHKKVLCTDQVKTDLLILMHLMGDLHQPLHTAYADDLGGNRVAVQYDTLKSNLHKFWDEDIIRINGITLAGCREFYRNNKSQFPDSSTGFDPVAWMKESRSFLDAVYDYPGFIIQEDYLKKQDPVIKHQLVLAGIRLAGLLNKLFASPAAEIDMKVAAANFKNGIEAKDAFSFIGKKVSACGRVFGIRTTDKVTLINLGDKYPNSPLTVVIFADDRKKFPLSLEDLFTDKNICVKGEIEERQGKAQIIVSDPEDIILLQ